MKAEKDLINDVLLRASERGHRLFRSNTGKGWVGKSEAFQRTQLVRVNAGDVVVRQARVLIAGLCVGGSDTIGWTADGRFAAIELKTPGVAITKEQKVFVDAVRRAGGCAGVALTSDEAMALLP